MSTKDGTRPTERTRVRRRAARGVYERDVIDAVLDEALVCHVGFVVDGQPFVIPTAHARLGDVLYLHGAAANRMLGTLSSGAPVCVTATVLDGLVLARSAFHHSLNYRSVVLLGEASRVDAPEEKRRFLDALMERVSPGRGAVVRSPSDGELAATQVVRFPIEEASAKIRGGPPVDDEEDLRLACWAGEVPLRLVAGEPVRDGHAPAEAPPPALPRWLDRLRGLSIAPGDGFA